VRSVESVFYFRYGAFIKSGTTRNAIKGIQLRIGSEENSHEEISDCDFGGRLAVNDDSLHFSGAGRSNQTSIPSNERRQTIDGQFESKAKHER